VISNGDFIYSRLLDSVSVFRKHVNADEVDKNVIKKMTLN